MAGNVRLAVTGIQDQWLTGEPQFSYFVMNYKRHTRFSTENVEIPFTFTAESGRKPQLGNSIICRVPNAAGDLLRSVMLKVTMEPLPESNLYYTSLGTRMIDYADLIIGGQTIERITGEYIYMYDQLHSNLDDTIQTLYFMTGHNNHLRFTEPYTFYVNLPFYFFRHPSLAIPVCAITKQLVEVRIQFKKDVAYDDPGSIRSASLLADFYYVTDEEKNFLLTRPVEYVITQLQLATVPFEPNVTTRSVTTHFKHPVKEMFFMANVQGNPEVVTSDTTLYRSDESNIRSNARFIKNISLDFNDTKVFDHNRLQLSYQQSLEHHTGCPSPAYEFYTYSFALKPDVYYPTGQVNMSRIRHQQLTVELEETDPQNETHVSVYAMNYNVLRVESGLAGLKF
jgi:hypothetical protein